MVPLVIPLVPMVTLVKTVGSQYCRQSTVWAKGSLTIRDLYAHFLEDQNSVVKLPALFKYRLGNKLMSYEEMDVGIFI